MTFEPRGRKPPRSQIVPWIGRFSGPVLAVATVALLAQVDGLSAAGRATAGVGVLMATWWMTEALPLPVTSLLPLVLFPLAGVLPIDRAAAPYANRFIFLFLGGFMIALAIEKWNLHRRIALLTVLAVGTRPANLVAGFMIATALLSMWISNTATAVMMLPIGLSVVKLLMGGLSQSAAGSESFQPLMNADEEPSTDAWHFATCLLLGIAYAASIGGMGTLVGTPPNVFLAGFLKDRGITIGFAQWMKLGCPLVLIYLLIAWLVLTRLAYPLRREHIPGARSLIRSELSRLGPVGRGEWTVLAVFVATAVAWVVRKPVVDLLLARADYLQRWPGLLVAVRNVDDTVIAITGATALFLIPVNARRGVFALDWQTASKLPWDVLLLFGGGLSLAAGVTSSELDKWIGSLLEGFRGLPFVALVVLVTVIVIFLTELTSNIATASAFLPILGGVAEGIGGDPLLLFVPAALAASCAFMLPVATPPNAIVFGSGHLTVGQMVKAGLWLNLVGVVLIPLITMTLGLWVLGG